MSLLKNYKGELYATLSGLMYGFIGYFGIHIMNAGYSVGMMTFWRWLTAALIAGIILKLKGDKISFKTSDILIIFLSGAIFYGPSSILYFYASKYIGTGLSMVIFFIFPAMVVLMNMAIYKTRVSAIYYLSIATIVTGMVLLADLGGAKFSMEGILLGLLSAFTYSCYVIACNKVSKVDPIASTLVLLLGCALSSAVFALMQDNGFAIPSETSVWVEILCLALIGTTLPVLLFLKSIKYISSNKASILSVLEPVFVVIFGVMLLNEKISSLQIVGVVIVLLGALIALVSKK